MKYTSTRGVTSETFEKVLFSGYAADGGLFVPEYIPKLDKDILAEWKLLKLSYPEVVGKIVRLYVAEAELTDSQLSTAIKSAYSKFGKSEVIPVTKINLKDGPIVGIAELFHGRTASFKDLALSLVGQLMEVFMETRGGHVTVLIGTSGDTGSASIEAVRGLSGVDIIVLYPKGMVSPVQELQMCSATEDNIHLFEVEGTSDDLDIPIEQCFPDSRLTSVNSINWVRIMIQISHYVYLYLLDEGDEPIHVVVPTGAAGNLTAGVFAKLMGVPLELHVATNENGCVNSLLTTGILEFGIDTVPTPANAMDICNPYNVERLLYLSTNSVNVKYLMTTKGKVVVPEDIKMKLQELIEGSKSIRTEDIYETMKSVWDDNQYVICPHTATAVNYAMSKLAEKPCYVLATASPFKFPEAATKAGIPLDKWVGDKLWNSLKFLPLKTPKLMKKGDDWLKILKDEIEMINGDLNLAGHS